MTITGPGRARAEPGAEEISQLRHVTMDHVDSPRRRAHSFRSVRRPQYPSPAAWIPCRKQIIFDYPDTVTGPVRAARSARLAITSISSMSTCQLRLDGLLGTFSQKIGSAS